MSRSTTNGWLRGTTIRKGGATTGAQRPSQGHVVSTSNTIFGGGVKDPSGRTSEYFVRRRYAHSRSVVLIRSPRVVNGRPMSSVQIGQVSKPQVAASRQLMLPQNVRHPSPISPANRLLNTRNIAGVNLASTDCSHSVRHHARYAKRPCGSWRSYLRLLRTSQSKKK